MKNLLIVTLPFEENDYPRSSELKENIQKLADQFGYECIENKSPLQAQLKSLIEDGLKKSLRFADLKVAKEKLYSIKELTKLFGVTNVTLRSWRRKGILPKPIRLGRRIYYSAEFIEGLRSGKEGSLE